MHDVHCSRACSPNKIDLCVGGHDTLASLNSVTHLSPNQSPSAVLRQLAPLCILTAERRSICYNMSPIEHLARMRIAPCRWLKALRCDLCVTHC